MRRAPAAVSSQRAATPLPFPARILTKAREADMATTAKTDIDREDRYRLGYAHGVRAALDALAENISAEDRRRLNAWFANTLTKWSRDQKMSDAQVPRFPAIIDTHWI
jgi:hypothetical protein